jgi:hypothetical protein
VGKQIPNCESTFFLFHQWKNKFGDFTGPENAIIGSNDTRAIFQKMVAQTIDMYRIHIEQILIRNVGREMEIKVFFFYIAIGCAETVQQSPSYRLIRRAGSIKADTQRRMGVVVVVGVV